MPSAELGRKYVSLFFIAFAVVIFFFTRSGEENSIAYFKNAEYSGQVAKKYYDPDRRHQTVIIVDGEKYTIYNQEMYDLISVGDTVLKRKGTLKHYLLKKGRWQLFYPIWGGKTHTDENS